MRRTFLLGSVFVILVFALIQSNMVDAKEIFYNSLDSKEAVEASGGKVFGGAFKDAKYGKGIYTDGANQAVRFPSEGNLIIEQGTIMLWVKVVQPKQAGESFMFMAYEDGQNAFYLVHSHGTYCPNGVAFAMKIGGTWSFANEDVNWKKDELHHIAGSYGKDGMKLYVDSKLAGEDKAIKGGPLALPPSIWIGSSNLDKWPGDVLPSYWIEDEVRIFDEQLNEAEIETASGPTVVEPADKLATTWGKVKGRVLR